MAPDHHAHPPPLELQGAQARRPLPNGRVGPGPSRSASSTRRRPPCSQSSAAARRTAVSSVSVQRLPIAITYLSNTDGPPHVPVSAGGSVKTPVAVQLLLPEMGGTTGFYEARTDRVLCVRCAGTPPAGRNPDRRAGLRRPPLQPLPATATARQSPRRTQRGAGGCLRSAVAAGRKPPRRVDRARDGWLAHGSAAKRQRNVRPRGRLESGRMVGQDLAERPAPKPRLAVPPRHLAASDQPLLWKWQLEKGPLWPREMGPPFLGLWWSSRRGLPSLRSVRPRRDERYCRGTSCGARDAWLRVAVLSR